MFSSLASKEDKTEKAKCEYKTTELSWYEINHLGPDIHNFYLI